MMCRIQCQGSMVGIVFRKGKLVSMKVLGFHSIDIRNLIVETTCPSVKRIMKWKVYKVMV